MHRNRVGNKQYTNHKLSLNPGSTKIVLGLIIAILLTASSLAFPITGESEYALANDAQPQSPVLLKGPYLQNVTRTTVTICWETEDPSRDSVEYGLTRDYGSVESDVNPFTIHEITLTDLTPSTTYHYRVESDGILTEDNTFTTAVDFAEPFTFVVYGDNRPWDDGTHRPPTAHTDVLNLIQQIGPDFYISTGDIVNKPDKQSDWDLFFDESRELMRNTTLFPVLGNHEGDNIRYFDYFSLPGNEKWYSFTYGNSYFIVLDTNQWTDFGPGSEQYQWLENELETASNTSYWKFVFLHHPPYSTIGHASDFEVRLQLCPLFEAHGVSMVFGGHNHSYEHTLVNDIHYIITAGGGAPLYSADEPEESWTVYREKTFHLTRVHIDGASLEFEAIRSPDETVMESFSISLPDVAPVVSSSTPAGENVSLSTPVAVTFSEPMNHASTQDAFSISPSVRGTFSWTNNTMTFTPASDLRSDKTYTVIISEEATSSQGSPLPAPYSWQFVTQYTPSEFPVGLLIGIVGGAVILFGVVSLMVWRMRKRGA